jgi:MYXO-CTERM domain-containing protein
MPVEAYASNIGGNTSCALALLVLVGVLHARRRRTDTEDE